MEHQNASIRQRAFAFSIDLAVIALVQLTMGSSTLWFYGVVCERLGFSPDYDILMTLSQFCGGFFFIAYFTFSVGVFGNTLGKHFLKLEVVHITDGNYSRPTLKQAYWRTMGYLMSSWTYMIGFLLPFFRKDGLTLHDLLCGTRVVRKNEDQLNLTTTATVYSIEPQPSPEPLNKAS